MTMMLPFNTHMIMLKIITRIIQIGQNMAVIVQILFLSVYMQVESLW